MSTDEERAALLRVIASAGYSPWDDQDGSTANTLYEMAEVLAPIAPPPPPRRAPWYRRQWLRFKLRRKMRRLGMLAVLAMGTLVPNLVTAQTPGDSLLGTALSRAAILPYSLGAVYCITWHAERAARPHVLVVIDAVVADTTLRPICPNPDGGFYPVWIDGPFCPPGNTSPFPECEWVLVRCPDGLARYRRPAEQKGP
jgi:hypothetical protein